VDKVLLITKASRSHSDTPNSVGLLWTSDQPGVETVLPDNTQHSQETDLHAPGGIRIRYPSKRTAADPGLRSRGSWDRRVSLMQGLIMDGPTAPLPSLLYL